MALIIADASRNLGSIVRPAKNALCQNVAVVTTKL
jgi:hypothetical protein